MSRTLRVLAVDPGELVGWATAQAHPDSLELGTHGISPLKDFALKLDTSIEKYDVVIYETYRLVKKLNRDGDDMQTSQLIGVIRFLSWKYPDVQIVGQSPKIKTTADKSAQGTFKDLIESEPGKHDDAHDIDAIRHLWYWFWKRQLKEAADGK